MLLKVHRLQLYPNGQRYYPGLKRAYSSLPPPSLSLTLFSSSISHQPPSAFIDHSAVPEDKQVILAAHPGKEKLISSQPEPAGRIPDSPAVPAPPVIPATAAAPPICSQDGQDFILPLAVQPPPPSCARQHNTLIPPASYPPPVGKCIRRAVHHGLPSLLTPTPAPVPRCSILPPLDLSSPSPSSALSSSPPAPSSSQPTRHSIRHNLGAPPGEQWKIIQPSSVVQAESDSDPNSDPTEDDAFEDADDGPSEAAQAVSTSDPWSLAQALTRPDAAKWKEVTHQKFDDLIANGSWEYCLLSPGAKAIGCSIG